MSQKSLSSFKSFRLLIVFAFITHFSYAQFDKTYEPIVVSGQLPGTYFEGFNAKVKTLAEGQQILQKDIAYSFYKETMYNLRNQFRSGNILYNDLLSTYVNKVAQKTFASNPSVINGISFYVSRSTSANAYCYPDGTIIINMGLLSLLDNEAQLAFIIAHEVAHYTKKHSLDAFNKKLTLKEQKADTETEKLIFLNLSYSREHESEADAYALTILSNSGYDATQAIPALEYLGKEDTALAPVRTDYFQLFSSEDFKLDSNWIKANNKFKPFTGSKSTKKSEVVKGDSDNQSTHPAFEKRIISLKEILKNIEYSATDKQVNLTDQNYTDIKTIAQFENANQAYSEAEYLLAVTFTGEALKKYPQNEFLIVLMVKTLYWTAYYDDINALRFLSKDMPIYQRGRYWVTANLFKNADAYSLKKMAFSFGKKYQKALDKNDEFSYYLALCTELFLGKETATIYFNQYQNKFVNGKYILNVNSRLSQ